MESIDGIEQTGQAVIGTAAAIAFVLLAGAVYLAAVRGDALLLDLGQFVGCF